MEGAAYCFTPKSLQYDRAEANKTWMAKSIFAREESAGIAVIMVDTMAMHISHYVKTACLMVNLYHVISICNNKLVDSIILDDVLPAGLLHDVGKLLIPPSILDANRALTSSEWSQMRMHPFLGEKILKGSENTLRELFPYANYHSINNAVKYHHERIDGHGYPYGISGNQIPQIARLCAVADTYDAVTSDRPYRRGKPKEYALSVLQSVAGTQLDAAYVQIALNHPAWTDISDDERLTQLCITSFARLEGVD